MVDNKKHRVHLFGMIKIAFKNLGRHKVKTILTTTAIAVSIFLFIFLDAWLLGSNMDSKRNLINFETGSSKIYSKAYFDKKDEYPLYESFDNYEPIINKLDKEGYNASPHAVFTGSLKSVKLELPFIFVGVDPEKEKTMFKYYEYIEPPAFISKSEFEKDILGKINNKKYRDKIENSYFYNDKKGEYELKKFNLENKKTKKIELYIEKTGTEIKELYEKADLNKNEIEVGLIDSQIKKNEKKLEDLKLKLKIQKERIEKKFNDEIKEALLSINYYNFLKKGEFSMLIGVQAAKDLDVKSGDEVNLYTVIDIKNEYGKIKHVHQVINLRIAGIVNSPNPKTNGNIGYLPLDILQDELGLMLEGHITEICIRKKGAKFYELPKNDEAPSVIINKLGDTLPDNLTVVSWRDDAKDYIAMSNQDKISSYIMLGFLLILATIGISNTMLMAIYERTKEIGMLRALGMRDNDVKRLFVIEAGLIGAIGATIGIILGILANIPMIKIGIDYTAMMESSNMNNIGYRVVGIFRSAWNWGTIFVCWPLATLISAFAAKIPAKRAMKKSIVDTMRFE